MKHEKADSTVFTIRQNTRICGCVEYDWSVRKLHEDYYFLNQTPVSTLSNMTAIAFPSWTREKIKCLAISIHWLRCFHWNGLTSSGILFRLRERKIPIFLPIDQRTQSHDSQSSVRGKILGLFLLDSLDWKKLHKTSWMTLSPRMTYANFPVLSVNLVILGWEYAKRPVTVFKFIRSIEHFS